MFKDFVITPLMIFVLFSFMILFLFVLNTTPHSIKQTVYYEPFDTSMVEHIQSMMNHTSIPSSADLEEYQHCPNLLIYQDGYYLLFNTRKQHIPSVNPLRFHTLDEYTEFMKWLRSHNIKCPILSLQKTNDNSYIDNQNVPFSDQVVSLPQWTLLYDASHDKGSIPSMDTHNQYIGNITPLDLVMTRGGNAGV